MSGDRGGPEAPSATDEELRALELDENAERVALADYEASKARLAEIRQAEADAKAEAAAPRTSVVHAPDRKRRRVPGSLGDVEARTGIPKDTRRRIEKHVEVAEQIPLHAEQGLGPAHRAQGR